MANIAKKYYNDEINRLVLMNKRSFNLSPNSRNLNLLALRGELAPIFHRETEIETVEKILLRRTKPNVLLTGPAGCGKTAIAEALAIHIANQKIQWEYESAKAEREYDKAYNAWNAENECKPQSERTSAPVKREVPKPPLCDAVIFDLSMNILISDTRYRGEFEKKLQNILNDCKKDSNIILFIDEIHQINTIGRADGSSSMGQILKPALARAEIRVIGATTTEESATIKEDKALARRFSEVEVRPMIGDKALETADSILKDYEFFHHVSVEDVTAKQILEMVNYHIGGIFPNNFIDVIDEAMSSAKFKQRSSINFTDIKETLSRQSGNIIL